MKNEVEVRCGLEASVFLKKGAKREPQGLPNELLLVPFGRLLAYFFDLCVPWGFQEPPPGLLARFSVVLGALLVSCWSGAEWSGVERSGAEWSGVERSGAE